MSVYVCLTDLKNAYDSVKREALWQVLRMYDVDVKLLNGIISIFFNSLVIVRVRWRDREGGWRMRVSH